MSPKPRFGGARDVFDVYTRDLTAEDLQRVFTRDARDAYRFFARGVDPAAVGGLPWPKRIVAEIRLFFVAFSLKLSPPRRALFGIALVSALIGVLELISGTSVLRIPLLPLVLSVPIPVPVWSDGTFWLVLGFVVLNVLVLVEVADRLTLKDDLEIARDIQQAMLPTRPFEHPLVQAFGLTRPANTVGGDFYDILPLADGRLAVALGDVAGKGSPAALLMALLIAILRTLIDEGRDVSALMARLNGQVSRHAPPSRFITLFLAIYDPPTGLLRYVNAGHLPPLIRRAGGRFERLTEGGVALGMFERSTYAAGSCLLDPGDLLVLYSDGITEAEDPAGHPFEEAGLERVIERHAGATPAAIGAAVAEAVRRYAQDHRLADDLTVLALRRVTPAAEAVGSSLFISSGV